MSHDIDNKVPAELRTQFGKGFARRARAAGQVPAVMYGHGTDPVHVTVPAHQVGLLLRKANAILDLQIAGKSHLVLVKDVQKDPVKQIIEHLDLIVVTKGEKVQVEVQVHLEGEAFTGTVVEFEQHTVTLEAEATNIPEFVTVSVEGLHEGAQLHAKDITLPKGASLVSDADALIAVVHRPQKAAASTEEAAAE
ncbi:MAG TPA: 50S ribosomal protein L25/general stress protein Ctc [Microbacteriaceae bacterium]|nr:50S ribosomal protein L25/general stress protein Ctc [Microbacteriaceae bacterium]